MRAGSHLGAMLEDYAAELAAGETRRGRAQPQAEPARGELAWLRARCGGWEEGRADGASLLPSAALVGRLENICALLDTNPAELPQSAAEAPAPDAHGAGAGVRRPPRLSRFLMRYTVRHTIAMALAFVSGLFANNPAMHAALWLLMIGGPPSHGATARKFTIRAVGAAIALVLAALGTLLLAPNGTGVFSYMVAIFAGSLLMAYIGQGGGLLSYLSIGGTAFVIAFSGPGPRNDAFASIWTIWGISFGMLIRAVVSMIWRERARVTLVEEFQAPVEALLTLVSAAHQGDRAPAEIEEAETALIGGVRDMLSVASDAQLEGHGAGIDAANLVDALDSLRRVGFILGNQAKAAAARTEGRASEEGESLEAALHARFADWLVSLRVQDADGVPSLAPLREMVLKCDAPDLGRWAEGPGGQARLVAMVRALEERLKTVSVY
jgi:uncharacterized membrane protein YccC